MLALSQKPGSAMLPGVLEPTLFCSLCVLCRVFQKLNSQVILVGEWEGPLASQNVDIENLRLEERKEV